jgi:V/A-type H+-transporting ATPase subunit C
MLVSSPEFVENSEYGYSVARIRARETKLVSNTEYNTLLSAPMERFHPLFVEITGIRGEKDADVHVLLQLIEETFTEQFFMVKGLILEDEIKRLISLEYDYELLKLIVKESLIGRVEGLSIPVEVSKRSNYSYPVLKSLLESGKFIDTGEILYGTYVSLRNRKELSGNSIDNSCESAYYRELFQILEEYQNPFLTGYYIRKVDIRNVLTALRLRVRGGKRADLRTRHLPYGSIDIGYLEQGLDLNIEGFASRIIFSPLGTVLKGVEKRGEETEQIVQAEKLMEEDLMRYVRESVFVTFGVEPVLSYLWEKEMEIKNLRTILLGKMTGVIPEEIRRYVRGLYG